MFLSKLFNVFFKKNTKKEVANKPVVVEETKEKIKEEKKEDISITPSIEVKEEEKIVTDEKKEDSETVVTYVKESTFEQVYLPFNVEDKDLIADLVRPVIKSFNNKNKKVYSNYMNGDVKTLKNFMTLSEDKMTITIRLTQSNKYNSLCYYFLLNIVEPMLCEALSDLFIKLDINVNDDGFITITKYEFREV